MLCVRELLRGVADATCVLSVLAPAALALGFAAADFGAGAASLPAVADVLLSSDDIGGLAVTEALLSIDVAGALAVVDALAPAPAEASVFAVALVGGEADVLAVVLSVVWAATTPAAAIAVTRRRIRGLNEDWFITTSNQ